MPNPNDRQYAELQEAMLAHASPHRAMVGSWGNDPTFSFSNWGSQFGFAGSMVGKGADALLGMYAPNAGSYGRGSPAQLAVMLGLHSAQSAMMGTQAQMLGQHAVNLGQLAGISDQNALGMLRMAGANSPGMMGAGVYGGTLSARGMHSLFMSGQNAGNAFRPGPAEMSGMVSGMHAYYGTFAAERSAIHRARAGGLATNDERADVLAAYGQTRGTSIMELGRRELTRRGGVPGRELVESLGQSYTTDAAIAALGMEAAGGSLLNMNTAAASLKAAGSSMSLTGFMETLSNTAGVDKLDDAEIRRTAEDLAKLTAATKQSFDELGKFYDVLSKSTGAAQGLTATSIGRVTSGLTNVSALVRGGPQALSARDRAQLQGLVVGGAADIAQSEGGGALSMLTLEKGGMDLLKKMQQDPSQTRSFLSMTSDQYRKMGLSENFVKFMNATRLGNQSVAGDLARGAEQAFTADIDRINGMETGDAKTKAIEAARTQYGDAIRVADGRIYSARNAAVEMTGLASTLRYTEDTYGKSIFSGFSGLGQAVGLSGLDQAKELALAGVLTNTDLSQSASEAAIRAISGNKDFVFADQASFRAAKLRALGGLSANVSASEQQRIALRQATGAFAVNSALGASEAQRLAEEQRSVGEDQANDAAVKAYRNMITSGKFAAASPEEQAEMVFNALGQTSAVQAVRHAMAGRSEADRARADELIMSLGTLGAEEAKAQQDIAGAEPGSSAAEEAKDRLQEVTLRRQRAVSSLSEMGVTEEMLNSLVGMTSAQAQEQARGQHTGTAQTGEMQIGGTLIIVQPDGTKVQAKWGDDATLRAAGARGAN